VLVRLLTRELADGLRQNIGLDQGRRSDRERLTSFFISFNVRHRGIEFLQIPVNRGQLVSMSGQHDVASGAIK
jgi:hypothetical protein